MRLWLLFVCVMGLSSCHSPRLLVWWGNQLYVRGEYTDATIHYIRAQEGLLEEGVIQYDLGNVYHALGETEAAESILRESITREVDPELVFRSRFNLGNISYERGDYAAAVEHYVQALMARPNDVDAKVNLETALRKAQNAGGGRERTSSDPEMLAEKYEKILGIIHEKEDMIWRSIEPQASDDPAEDW